MKLSICRSMELLVTVTVAVRIPLLIYKCIAENDAMRGAIRVVVVTC